VERLSVLNLTYDVTPAECITSVVCESGLVAPTDVPSFLR
jgi:translation initiation factor eIF-2B subunit delta